MTALADDLVIGVVLGFSLVVPPGPMNAWIASVAARSYRAGVVTGLGAMTADGVLAAGVYLLEQVVDVHAAVRYVYLVGAAVMGFLGVRLLRRSAGAALDVGDQLAFARALLIGLSNPFQVVWWLTAGVAFAYLGGAILLVGLFGAIVVWIVCFPAAIRAGARRRESFEYGVQVVSAAILLGFAAYFVALFVLS